MRILRAGDGKLYWAHVHNPIIRALNSAWKLNLAPLWSHEATANEVKAEVAKRKEATNG